MAGAPALLAASALILLLKTIVVFMVGIALFISICDVIND
jgi:hypothetical protein